MFGVHWVMPKTVISFFFFFCLGQLVWEAPVNYLEYDNRLPTVVSLVGI